MLPALTGVATSRERWDKFGSNRQTDRHTSAQSDSLNAVRPRPEYKKAPVCPENRNKKSRPHKMEYAPALPRTWPGLYRCSLSTGNSRMHVKKRRIVLPEKRLNPKGAGLSQLIKQAGKKIRLSVKQPAGQPDNALWRSITCLAFR